MNVSEYFLATLGHDIEQTDANNYQEFPMASVCGDACRAIIDSAAKFLHACDPSLTGEIVMIADNACSIVCFG